MCRQSLNFKGLHRLEEKWSEEARQQQIDDLFGEYLDDMLDGCVWLGFFMFELEETQKKLQQMSDWDFDKDLFEGVMYDAIDLVIISPPREYDEPRTFEHTLFASKYPIRSSKGKGTKRSREFKTGRGCESFEVLVLV
jgi:hypothetical protein